MATEFSLPACLFCEDIHGELHKAETMTLDARVRQMATDIKDTQLLSKLAAGDLVAIDSVYHRNCLRSFYNRHRSLTRRSIHEPNDQMNAESLALAEVISHIEEYTRLGGDINHVFTLSDIKALYSSHITRFGGEPPKKIHSRLACKIQQHIPSLEVNHSQSGTVLSFKKDIGDTLLGACNESDDVAILLMRVAKLMRKDIFNVKYRYDNSLCDDNYDNLPTSVTSLIRMILEGPNTDQETDENRVIPTFVCQKINIIPCFH